MTADTIVPDPNNPQQMNRYTYVLGNPIQNLDPSGHCVFGIDTAICVAVAFGGGLGMIANWGVQVYQNLESGLDTFQAVYHKNLDMVEIGGSGLGGMVSGGLAAYALPAAPLLAGSSRVGTVGISALIGGSANVAGDATSRIYQNALGTSQPDMFDPLSYSYSFFFGMASTGIPSALDEFVIGPYIGQTTQTARSVFVDDFKQTGANNLWDHQIVNGQTLYPPSPDDMVGFGYYLDMEYGPLAGQQYQIVPINAYLAASGSFGVSLAVNADVLNASRQIAGPLVKYTGN